MTRPLYRAPEPDTRRHGHAGLWYEKYCNLWRIDAENPLGWSLKAKDRETPKVDWVKTVIAGQHGIGGDTTQLLNEHHARQRQLCAAGHALQQNFQTTGGRLVLGIGQNHPVENGFLWHPTLGVPYLPGSSIKGMLRNWLLIWLDQGQRLPWFESLQGKGVGELIFLDALPTSIPALEADVITPHYSPWYRDPQHTPPADWHNPTPTPFLTVAPGTTFAVRVMQRRPPADNRPDFAPLLQALGEAFDTLGIGAKTAVGYGRLVPVTQGSRPPAMAPAAPTAAADPLQAFKAFCTRFGSIAANKGAPGPMIKALLDLPEATRALAIEHLKVTLKTKKKDCTPKLADILFPPEAAP